QFEYILIDEYQDTNTAQYELAKLLTNERQHICVVGDASQSIYAWRGANFRNIFNFKNDFPKTRIFHLEQNYRSTQTILDAAYHVIAKNNSHPILKLWTDNDGGEKIHIFEARSENEEAAFIISLIASSQFQLSDIAILYRTNAQSRLIEEALLHTGIPYVLVGGVRFYERKEVKDVLAYLKLIVNPADRVAEKRITGIGKQRTQRFHAWRTDLTTGQPTLDLLDEVIKITAYLDLYDKEDEEDRMRLENIKELRSVASEFPDLTNFLENVALVQAEYMPDQKSGSAKPNSQVTLMTLHSAKGLEFPIVFIIGMEEGLFPHSRSLLDSDELEEERRLCYVGITRAKEKLYVTYARRRLFYGTYTSNMVSRFVSDIPESLIERINFSSY
ncbi:MAG: 3'-5' exonuclease, partial [Patescibacteria group bacterium]